jgi:hypothetical protein
LKNDETEQEHTKIKDADHEIEKLKTEKVKEEKRNEKLKLSKEELVGGLKQRLVKLNIEVV